MTSDQRSDVSAAPAASAGTTRVDMVVLALPLLIAALNPGTGFISGMYAAVVVAIYALVRRVRAARSLASFMSELALVDWLAVIAAGYVLVSPLWSYDVLSWSASRGAIASLAYFVAARLLVRTSEDLGRLLRYVALMCLVYAVYFLVDAHALDPATSRRSVDFANANYTAAVLGYGAVVSLYLAIVEARGTARSRALWGAAFLLEAIATLESGSRAGFAGVVAAVAVLLLARFGAIWVYRAVLVLLVAGFLIGFVPLADGLFQGAADTLRQTSLGTFTRSQEALSNLSGRQEIWVSTRQIISQSPWFGSGLEGYRLRGSIPILAHSWGMEYVAAVGVLGTIPLVWMTFASYLNRGVGAARRLTRGGLMFNAATALVLLPSLMLSTHQWTLWAWAAFALWSRAHLMEQPVGPVDLVGLRSAVERAVATTKARLGRGR